jgi:hypothetical protein
MPARAARAALFRFEHRSEPLLPRAAFLKRLARSIFAAFLMGAFALAIGMAGYAYFEHMALVDSFVNASMILSGMGPVGTLQTDGGKIFAGCYALFSGLLLITIVATILAPIFHRFIHQFHLDKD